MTKLPDGFSPLQDAADYLDLIGPVYVNADGVLGVRIEDRHRNSGGTAHGGFLATLVDTALGRAIHAESDEPAVTVSLTTDYLKGVEVGQWVEAHTEVERVGGSLAFADCSLRADGAEVVRGRAVFAVLGG